MHGHPPTNAASPPPGYFGSGQDADHPSMSQRWLWVWTGQRLQVARGREHGKDVDFGCGNVEALYRGWFDPHAGQMFVVSPNRSGRPDAPLRGIPRIVDRALRRRFGEHFQYRLF